VTRVIELAGRVTDGRAFQNLILAVILLTAVLVGLETSEPLVERHRTLFDRLDMAVQAIFVAEIALRLLAHAPRVHRFFADGWNVFDFAVVAASLLPQAGTFAVVARLARLLRVARLVSVFPELRLIVSTMLRSIPSMGHVILMLSLLLYVYGVLGFYLFRGLDPERWGSLGASFLTLFQILTLEGWVEVQGVVLPARPLAWAYFASFVFIGVFVVVNLFIAVVINNLESAKVEQLAEADRLNPQQSVFQAIGEIRERLDRLERVVRNAPPPDGRLAVEPRPAPRGAPPSRSARA
jgi:voltage-gated sodium channel